MEKRRFECARIGERHDAELVGIDSGDRQYCSRRRPEIQCHSGGAASAMAGTTMVHVRLDEKVKAAATETLAAMGLSVSDAVRVFLMRVVAEKQLPFELKVPNAATRQAIAEADAIVRARRPRFATANKLFDNLEKNRGR